MSLNKKTVLITGGTGSAGQEIISQLIERESITKIIIYSRDEHKQEKLYKLYENSKYSSKLRFFIGDVRDKDRLITALNGVSHVIHTAALKIVPAMEYNPGEAVKTNVIGTQNVIDACAEARVERATLLSTDKAVSPINLYGATKMVAEKLFIAANNMHPETDFNVCRYGNVTGSHGSVIPYFKAWAEKGIPLLITHYHMTRFWITLEEAADLAIKATLQKDERGCIFVPEMKAYNLEDLALCFSNDHKIVGIRTGEKLHEDMITTYESIRTRKKGGCFIIYPEWQDKDLHFGIDVLKGGSYHSNNSYFLSRVDLRDKLIELGWLNKEPEAVLS